MLNRDWVQSRYESFFLPTFVHSDTKSVLNGLGCFTTTTAWSELDISTYQYKGVLNLPTILQECDGLRSICTYIHVHLCWHYATLYWSMCFVPSLVNSHGCWDLMVWLCRCMYKGGPSPPPKNTRKHIPNFCTHTCCAVVSTVYLCSPSCKNGMLLIGVGLFLGHGSCHLYYNFRSQDRESEHPSL